MPISKANVKDLSTMLNLHKNRYNKSVAAPQRGTSSSRTDSGEAEKYRHLKTTPRVRTLQLKPLLKLGVCAGFLALLLVPAQATTDNERERHPYQSPGPDNRGAQRRRSYKSGGGGASYRHDRRMKDAHSRDRMSRASGRGRDRGCSASRASQK